MTDGRRRDGVHDLGATGPTRPVEFRRLDVDGPLHVALTADAEPQSPLLLCVHGLGGSWANWLPLLRMLRLPGGSPPLVAAVDLPGFGLTRSAGRRCDVRAYAAVTAQVVAALGHDRALLLGNSMGGLVTLLTARDHRERVSGVVLLDTAQLVRPQHRPNPVVSGMFGSYFVPGLGPAVVAARRWIQDPRRFTEDTLRLVTAHPRRIPPDVVQAHVDVARARRSLPEVPRDFGLAARSMGRELLHLAGLADGVDAAGVPVLLLHGERDRLVPLAAARELAVRHPGWDFAIAADTGHVPQLEAPGWTADRITSWLARHPEAHPCPRVR